MFWFASLAVIVKVKGALAVEVAGTPLRTSWVAVPGLMVTGEGFASAAPEMLAAIVADPAVIPVKVEV